MSTNAAFEINLTVPVDLDNITAQVQAFQRIGRLLVKEATEEELRVLESMVNLLNIISDALEEAASDEHQTKEAAQSQQESWQRGQHAEMISTLQKAGEMFALKRDFMSLRRIKQVEGMLDEAFERGMARDAASPGPKLDN